MDNHQVRVILWSISRTLSTAFEKSMSSLDDVQIIHEPYVSAYYYGPDKSVIPDDRIEDNSSMANATHVEYEVGWNSETATYQYLKDLMEGDYPGKKVVFVKDMAYTISDKLDLLPEGYRHAFLIRKPIRVFASYKNVLKKFPKIDGQHFKIVGGSYFLSKYFEFGESLQLYEHLVKTGIEPNPVVIDSDDLLENPKSILQQFCHRTGIPYTDKLLNWEAGNDALLKWKASDVFVRNNKISKFYSNAFESTSFGKPKPEPKRSELEEDVNEAIDATLPYYEKLYELRIKP